MSLRDLCKRRLHNFLFGKTQCELCHIFHYRLLKFKNRTELSDYLMLKYDNSWGQDTAHTFILENSDLMDGWRILDEQENAS